MQAISTWGITAITLLQAQLQSGEIQQHLPPSSKTTLLDFVSYHSTFSNVFKQDLDLEKPQEALLGRTKYENQWKTDTDIF